jgi:hypothetical protein
MVSFLTADLQGPGPSIFDTFVIAAEDILALDQLAVAAWPAPVNDACNVWLLRFAHGITRRANSVPPFPLVSDARHIDDLINAVEAYYRNHELPPRFQISPAAEPNDLDAQLAARGYEIETPVTIEIAAAHALPPLRACQFPSQRRRHRVGGMFIKKVSPGTPERLLRYLEINRSTPRGATTKIKSQRLALACLATNGSASMACGRALNTGAKVLESQLSATFQPGRLNMEP